MISAEPSGIRCPTRGVLPRIVFAYRSSQFLIPLVVRSRVSWRSDKHALSLAGARPLPFPRPAERGRVARGRGVRIQRLLRPRNPNGFPLPPREASARIRLGEMLIYWRFTIREGLFCSPFWCQFCRISGRSSNIEWAGIATCPPRRGTLSKHNKGRWNQFHQGVYTHVQS